MKTNKQLLIDKIIETFKEDFKGMTSDNKTLIVKIRNKTIEVNDYNEMELDELMNAIEDKINDENN